MLFSNVIVCPLNVSNFPLTEFISLLKPEEISFITEIAVISWLSALVMLFSNVIVCPLNVSNFPLTEFISLLKPEEISFITEIADVTAE